MPNAVAIVFSKNIIIDWLISGIDPTQDVLLNFPPTNSLKYLQVSLQTLMHCQLEYLCAGVNR
jgi:hypothetical protein